MKVLRFLLVVVLRLIGAAIFGTIAFALFMSIGHGIPDSDGLQSVVFGFVGLICLGIAFECLFEWR